MTNALDTIVIIVNNFLFQGVATVYYNRITIFEKNPYGIHKTDDPCNKTDR